MLASTVASFQDNSTHGEDSYLTLDLGNGSFLDGVMDGVTGHGGQEASTSVVNALRDANASSADQIVEILNDLNDEFFQVGGGRFLLTTVSITLYQEGQLYVVSAGDSPILLIDQGAAQQLSGRVGGFMHVGVAKAIGATAQLDNLNRRQLEVPPGARILLATDGVTDNMHTDELAELIQSASSPDEAATSINKIVETRLEEGRVPEQLGRRFRHDDRTAIFRFFA